MVTVSAARVVKAWPHDPDAFTQGLCWADGQLYESTGLIGASSVRKVRLRDGKVLQRAMLDPTLFGEGLTLWDDAVLSVTYQDGQGFRWDPATLRLKGSFVCPGEAWGLTHDGASLVLSDGTPVLRFLDPVSFAPRRSLLVSAGGRPVPWLNELQWVHGEIFANVLTLPAIARIDPASGAVRGWIDLSPIVASEARGDREKVANGIAHDGDTGRLYVTGKNWAKLYEIAL